MQTFSCTAHPMVSHCGMQIYVMADIVILDAPDETSHFYITFHYTYLHYVRTYFVSTYTAFIYNLITKASIMCKF